MNAANVKDKLEWTLLPPGDPRAMLDLAASPSCVPALRHGHSERVQPHQASNNSLKDSNTIV